jgi:hypothetical protein
MNSLCKEHFLHKAHDLIALKSFKNCFVRMTKEMTSSIGGNQTKFKPNMYCTSH